MRMNHTDPVRLDAYTFKERHQLSIDSDDSVESPKDKPAQGATMSCPPFFRYGIAARMKREHSFAARHKHAKQAQCQQSRCEASSNVEMNQVVLKSQEKSQ